MSSSTEEVFTPYAIPAELIPAQKVFARRRGDYGLRFDCGHTGIHAEKFYFYPQPLFTKKGAPKRNSAGVAQYKRILVGYHLPAVVAQLRAVFKGKPESEYQKALNTLERFFGQTAIPEHCPSDAALAQQNPELETWKNVAGAVTREIWEAEHPPRPKKAKKVKPGDKLPKKAKKAKAKKPNTLLLNGGGAYVIKPTRKRESAVIYLTDVKQVARTRQMFARKDGSVHEFDNGRTLDYADGKKPNPWFPGVNGRCMIVTNKKVRLVEQMEIEEEKTE